MYGEKIRVRLPSFRMQGLGLPSQAAPRKGKEQAKGKRSHICRVCAEHVCVDILDLGGQENNGIKVDQTNLSSTSVDSPSERER